jgi:hypothetical protein
MMTRRLWLALRYPPEIHPIFREIKGSTDWEYLPWFLWLVALLLLPLLILPAVILAGTAYGLFWSVNIANTISTERRYELLCILPGGALSAHWLLATGSMHRNNGFARVHSPALWVTRILFGALLIAAWTHGETLPVMVELSLYLIAGMALFINHYTSVVISAMVGMLMPTLVNDKFSLLLMTFGITGLLHVASWIMPLLLVAPNLSLTQRTLLQLLMFAAVREGMVLVLWRMLVSRLGANDEILDWRSHHLIQ